MENRIHNQWWTTQTIWWSTKQTILTKHTKRVRRIQIIFVHFVNDKQWRKWTFIHFIATNEVECESSALVWQRQLLKNNHEPSLIKPGTPWLNQWYNYDHYFIVTGTSTRSLVTCVTYYSLFHFSMSEFDHSFVFNLMFHKCWVLTSSEIKEDCQLWYKACPAPPSISITYALHDTPVPNCGMLWG